MRLRLSLPSVYLLSLLGALAPSMAGCSQPDLGTRVYEIPKVPGADKPYEMPQLDEPQAEPEEAAAKAADAPAETPDDAAAYAANGGDTKN